MPKEYSVDGASVKLYTIGELAQAAKRSLKTVRRWEKKGVLPLPKYRKNGVRLYTQEQVDLVSRARMECALKRGRVIADTGFTNKLSGGW